MFQIHTRDTQTRARTGMLSLAHGTVETPVFMPVGTQATVKALTMDQMRELGFDIILGNSYHLYLRPGMDVIRAAGSLHEFSTWDRNILTDSGGFQVFSLAPFRKIREEGVRFRSHIDGSYHNLSPEDVVGVQRTLNSDILMQLDVCTEPGITYKKAAEAVGITTRWAARSKTAWLAARDEGYKGQLFGIVQGNFFEDLRARSAAEIVDLDLPGIAIGGLSVGESPDVFESFLASTAILLPEDKPRYVMGIGTPEYILSAVENGIDMFDCVLPTRVARNGAVFTRDGLLAFKREKNTLDQGPADPDCRCSVCRTYTRSYLRHLFKANEILGPMLATYHNLAFMANLMSEIRDSIRAGQFAQYKSAFLSRYTSKLA